MGGSKAGAIAVYSALRLGLLAGVWLIIELLTPISGVWAIVLAILVSGALSIVVLDRVRNRAGLAVGGFFSSINARIDASARAEDEDPLSDASSVVGGMAEPIPPTTDDASGQGEQNAEQQALDQQAQADLLEDRDEGGTHRPT